jgi:hypothetical protein
MSNQLSEEQRIAIEKYELKKAKSRVRSKAYYDRKKETVLERQKKTREANKNEIEKIRQMLAVSSINDNNVYIEEQNEIVGAPVETSKRSKTNYTEDEIVNLLQNDDTFKSENTRKTYISSIRRVFSMTKCADFKKCLDSYKKMINDIEKSDYSINSIKQTLQSILFVSDKYNILHNLFSKKKADSLKTIFLNSFEKFKDKSMTQLEEAQQTVQYPTFSEYLGKVKTLFGENSKEYLISYLYSQFTVRDNFAGMQLIESLSDDNKKNNFLLLTRAKMTFIINKFKTKNKYNRLEFTVTGKLKSLLNDWIIKHQLAYGDYLFGKSPLSTFVSHLNKKLGYNDLKGVGIFRHIRVSELHHNKNLTFEERKKLADEMAHSLMVQKNYKRNLKII